MQEAVAVTQNYVGRSNLPHVLRFLRSRSEALVSGCAKGQRAHLFDRFEAVLKVGEGPSWRGLGGGRWMRLRGGTRGVPAGRLAVAGK